MDLSKLAQNIYKYYYPYLQQYSAFQNFPKEFTFGNIDVKNLPGMINGFSKWTATGFSG